MNFILIVYDGNKLRAFHPPVLNEVDRHLVEGVVKNILGKENGHAVDLTNSPSLLLNQIEVAKDLGYTGESCTICHSIKMRRTGTCVTCQDCGNNAGCG